MLLCTAALTCLLGLITSATSTTGARVPSDVLPPYTLNNAASGAAAGRPAVRAEPSQKPAVFATGFVAVFDAVTETQIGYIAAGLTSAGVYYVTSDKALALQVTAESGGSKNFVTLNGPDGFPLIGGTLGGNADLKIGTNNYFLLTGTTQTARLSPLVTGPNTWVDEYQIESSVWNYDPATSVITIAWVNSDNSQPPVEIVTGATDMTNERGYIAGTSDAASFIATFPGDSPDIRTFNLVP